MNPDYETELDEAVPVQNDSVRRKATPIYSGVLRYFPDALAAVARLSKAGNDKHNPGEPLRWAREKSTDHGDCIVRHQLEPEKLDPETGELHAASVAWRALAQLQLLEEARTREQLNGPMGRVEFPHKEVSVTSGAPYPGSEWERGTGERPAWASDGTLVEYRTNGRPIGKARMPQPMMGWHDTFEYRIAR